MSDIYAPTRTETDPELGETPAYVASRPDRIRCRRSAGSLTAIGPRAAELMAGETEDDMFGRYRALVVEFRCSRVEDRG